MITKATVYGIVTLTLTGFFAARAAAAAVTYVYAGSVASCPNTEIPPCGEILFEGDAVSGPFQLDEQSIAPLTAVGYGAFSSFSVMVGELFAVDSDNAELTGGAVKFNQAGHIAGGYLTLLAQALPEAPPTQITLDLSNQHWIAEALLPTKPVLIASGGGGFLALSTAVPLPGAWFLFLPAVLGLSWFRGR